MSTSERCEAALHSIDPSHSLAQLAIALVAAGDTPELVIARCEPFRVHLRNQQREQDEDRLLEVMDRIVGWCGPHAKLFPQHRSQADGKTIGGTDKADT